MTQIQRIRAIVESPTMRPKRKLLEITEIVRRKRTYRCAGKTADLKAYMRDRYHRLRAAGFCTTCEQPSQKSMCAMCATAKKLRQQHTHE